MSDRSGRRRTTDRHILADDQALDQISKEAEEKLQARRQARAEAREIRMREIERQQKEEEEREKSRSQGQAENPKLSSFTGSRRGSDASSESDVSSNLSQDPKDHIRELKHQLRDFEEKYKQAMVTNAQLDNTITTQMFHLELLKEEIEEKDESILECQREYKSKSREYELLKRDHHNLQTDCDGLKEQMAIKDQLLQDSGLVIVSSEEGVLSLSKCSELSDISVSSTGATLISQESAEYLQKAGEGTLGKSNQVTDPVCKPNVIVDNIVSGLVSQGKPHLDTGVPVPDNTNEVEHDKDLDKKLIDNSGNKEQIATHVSKSNVENETDNLNIKDINSNDVKSNSDSLPDQNDNAKDANADEVDSKTELEKVDSGIKIEIDLTTDSEETEKTENKETYGLSKSLVSRLEKMTEGADYKQGLCTSISFESDVTYHRESEDELPDNDETEDTNAADKVNKKKSRLGSSEETFVTGIDENQKEVGGSSGKVRFKIGEDKSEGSTGSQFGSITDQFIDELSFQAVGQSDKMLSVVSVDDVSSMLVDYDPNENVSLGDITDDRLDDFESGADSGDDEDELKERVRVNVSSKEKPIAEDLKLRLGLKSDEFVDGLPGNSSNSYPGENMDEVGSMVVCYDPNETVSVGDITDVSRFEEFASNADSGDEENEYRDNSSQDLASALMKNPKVLSLADRPGLVGGPKRFLNATQSCDDVSSMMVEYDPSETVSVSDVTDTFEDHVDNSEMTVANVMRKDYVPGNLSTINYWVRSVSREETDIIDQYIEDRNETSLEERQSIENSGIEGTLVEQLDVLAKDYVEGIIKDAVQIVNATPTEKGSEHNISKETDLVGEEKLKEATNIDHDMSINSGEPLDISTPSKTSLSEESVLPLHKPSDRSSVNILSPITHLTEEESHEGVEFFSYELQTQASVVLSTTRTSESGEATLEETDEALSQTLPDISGYGVCLSGEGLEEMEKYYKEMTALSETEKDKGLTAGGDMNWSADISDHIRFVAMAASTSPLKDEVFTTEHEESITATDKERNGSESEPSKRISDGENEVLPSKGKVTSKDESSHSVIDDWAKKDYEAAAGHHSEEMEADLKNLSEETKDTCSSTDTLDNETEKQLTASKDSLSETASKTDRLTSSSSDSGAVSKRKKSKKQEKDIGEGKRSSGDARSSASDVDKRSSGSQQSTEADSEKHGKKGSHSRKKSSKEGKEHKDECSVS